MAVIPTQGAALVEHLLMPEAKTILAEHRMVARRTMREVKSLLIAVVATIRNMARRK